MRGHAAAVQGARAPDATRVCTVTGNSRTYIGVSACESCHGTGKIRYAYEGGGGKAGTRKCAPCGQRGWVRCAVCDKGTIECLERPKTDDCRTCRGEGTRPCPLCRVR